MKHLKNNRKFGRVRKQRKALLKHLAHALILNEKIKTTEPKAKSLKIFMEKLITKGKKQELASMKLLSSRISKQSSKKLFNEISPRYKDRNGGYTRIIKLPPRKSDGAKVAYIELVK